MSKKIDDKAAALWFIFPVVAPLLVAWDLACFVWETSIRLWYELKDAFCNWMEWWGKQ